MFLWLSFLGCQTPDATPAEPSRTADPATLLRRLSLDLRGIPPSLDDYAAVEADPGSLDAIAEAYLYEPGFGERVRDLYAEVFLTRQAVWPVTNEKYGVARNPYVEAAGQEALRIVSQVAEEDLPYTELVTGNWTMANETLGAFMPVDYPDGETGWRKVAYIDQRPAAGILTTSTMWWRFQSTLSNANRQRAAVAARIFLCHDYADRPIDFDSNSNLLDEEAILSALENNPSCVNCHVSLDPLASYFFGFWASNMNGFEELLWYYPAREEEWKNLTGIAPGYFGEPAESGSLGELGQRIAADPRFATCAVSTVAELLFRRELDTDDDSYLTEHREAFLDGDLTIRSLFRSITADPRYRASAESTEPGAIQRKLTVPELLASQVEALTAFTWRNNESELLRSPPPGLLVAAGGVDGVEMTRASRVPNVPMLLIQERLAEAAASHVITQEEQELGSSPLLEGDEFSAEPSLSTLRRLRLAILGDPAPADEDLSLDQQLWQDAYDLSGSTAIAWQALLSSLLRDPDLLFY